MEDFYALNFKAIWRHFKTEHISFLMICGYLFVEYVRPQSIFPAIDFLPWAQLFLLGALLGWLADTSKRWVRSPVNGWMLFFLVSILASSATAYVPSMSWGKLEFFYTWFVIYFLIINIVNTPKRLFIFLSIFLLASFKISASLARVWAFRGFSFSSWGLAGPPGFFQNSGELAIQMAVFWPMGLAFAQALRPYVVRWKYLVMMAMPVTGTMVILGASSRGGQLALAGQMLMKFNTRILNPKVLIIGLLVASIGWLLLPPEQKERFTKMGDDKTSQQRLLYWENGIEMYKDHPVLGVGYFNFVPYFTAYYPQDILLQRAELPHNIFVHVGSELGTVGLVGYLGLIFSGLKIARSTHRTFLREGGDPVLGHMAGAMNLSFLGFILAGQFVTVTYYPFMWIHLALVVCMDNVCRNSRREADRVSRIANEPAFGNQ